MSESLKSLKELLEILDYYKDKAQRNFQTIRIFSELPNYIKEIETELKEHKTLQDDFNKLYERTYKEHKALKIIKEKEIDVGELMDVFKDIISLEEYNDVIARYSITIEEYNLLKDVLL